VVEQRQIVRQYVRFMQRIAGGDYDAQLDRELLNEGQGQDRGQRELRQLGTYLTEMVSSLIAALRDMQVLQRRYLGTAWREFERSNGNPSLYSVGDASERDLFADLWQPMFQQSLGSGELIIEGNRLALPILLGSQPLGVVGAKLEEGTEWTDEQLILAQSVMDQLAQTMENLRLVNQTQRTAQRERMIGQISTHLRASLDLEAMLKTAADEMQRALGLGRVSVHLMSQQPGESNVQAWEQKE
jgi:hypothetical protein